MRISLIAAVCFFVLSACGNSNTGIPFNPYATTSSAAATTTGAAATGPTATNDPPMPFGACVPMTVLAGSDANFAQLYAGAQVCQSTVNSAVVKLIVGPSFPAMTQFCLLPATNTPSAGTCFTISGQGVVTLPTTDYSSLVLIAASDMAAYTAYVDLQTNMAPPRAIAALEGSGF